MSWSTSEWKVRLIQSYMFKHYSNVLTDRSKAVLLLWIFVFIYVSRLSLSLLFLAALWYLLGKDWPLGSLVCDGFFRLQFLSLSHYGVSGQVLYLIVSILDVCLILFFALVQMKWQKNQLGKYGYLANPLIREMLCIICWSIFRSFWN